jgi:hypothetical protein
MNRFGRMAWAAASQHPIPSRLKNLCFPSFRWRRPCSGKPQEGQHPHGAPRERAQHGGGNHRRCRRGRLCLH